MKVLGSIDSFIFDKNRGVVNGMAKCILALLMLINCS